MPKEFELANMTDDLMTLSLELCGKDENKTPRFPKLFYPNYVNRVINTALDIQEKVIIANETRIGPARTLLQEEAAAKCVYLNHLIRIAKNKGYISEKQRERWQKLTVNIRWAIARWMQSDAKRT